MDLSTLVGADAVSAQPDALMGVAPGEFDSAKYTQQYFDSIEPRGGLLGLADSGRNMLMSLSGLPTTAKEYVQAAGRSVAGDTGATWALPVVLVVLAAGVLYLVTGGRKGAKLFGKKRVKL